MTQPTTITLGVFIVLLAGFSLASFFVTARIVGIEYIAYTANAGELARNNLVGQTFIARENNLSGISVLFATYSGRKNSGPVLLHLRSSIYEREDIRMVSVASEDLGDNQLHLFEFDPVQGSAGKSFFFFVVSPEASLGSAVAVDIDTRDPYHEGSAYIVHGTQAVTDPLVLEMSGKQTIDVAFSTHHSVPFQQAAKVTLMHSARAFQDDIRQRPELYRAEWRALMQGILFFVVLSFLHPFLYGKLIGRFGKRGVTFCLLALLFVLALGFRLIYARELPITDDEGNYLYDARSLTQGFLAGGDGYVKAPLVILWIALWQMFIGETLIAGRFSSVIVGALTLFPIYFLAKDLWSSRVTARPWIISSLGTDVTEAGWGRRVGIAAAAMWALFGTAVVGNVYVHTQPLAQFLGVSGLAVVLASLRGTVPKLSFYSVSRSPAGPGWFFFSGMLLGLAVASRKSILAMGLLPILFLIMEKKSWRLAFSHAMAIASGFLIIVSFVIGLAFFMYGNEGAFETIGLNSAQDGVNSIDREAQDQVRAYSIRGVTPFFRESLPIIPLFLIGLGVAIEHLIRTLIRSFSPDKKSKSQIAMKYAIAKIAWIFPWTLFVALWRFFFEYEGEAFMRFGIPGLWYVFAALLLWMTLIPQRSLLSGSNDGEKASLDTAVAGTPKSAIHTFVQAQQAIPRHMTAAFAVPLWIGGLVAFYVSWIKFHANYIADFIAPLVVLSAFGVVALCFHGTSMRTMNNENPFLYRARGIIVMLGCLVLLWAVSVSNFITFFFEHTGTFQQGAAKQAAVWARDHIPKEEVIFTGAALIPYLSGHHTALDISHPRWYAYEFTRKDPQRLNTFLPSVDEMLQAYRDSTWFLLEKQTGFSFLMEYEEIEKGLERDWVLVHEVENGGNPLKFYRRVQ